MADTATDLEEKIVEAEESNPQTPEKKVEVEEDDGLAISPVKEDTYKRPKMNDEDRKRLADTNMENYGGEEHRNLRRSTARKEKAWRDSGDLTKTEKGNYLSDTQKIEVWRIEKFKVKHWPVKRYGEFYRGDSYIILNTYKPEGDSDRTLYNVHFWLGSESSQDEVGTAAYKTVELDDFLGDLPVQYREVDGYENKEFLNLFPRMTVLEGGVDSGFNRVEKETFEPRLLHISDMHGKIKNFTQVKISQLKLHVDSLNDHDTFILDLGDALLQFHAPLASFREKFKAGQVMNQIAHDRHGKVKKTYTVDWVDDPSYHDGARIFWQHFGGKPKKLQEQKDEEEETLVSHEKMLFHVSDETGEMRVDEVARGDKVSKDLLKHDDAFILDLGHEMFVWVGNGANKQELREAMMHAIKFLDQSGRPAHTPVIRVTEGLEPQRFWAALGGK